MTILSVSNVTKRYAHHTALDGVSIEVPDQSIFGLLGPNGAGKTSLIRIINQITGPDEGEIFFKGEKLSPHHVSHIGYLPEERGLYRKMEVGEQALYLAQLKGMSRSEALKKLKYWFEKFEIIGWWKKKVEELSKGMQQKVQFIVTVLHQPDLLILDEPFTGFDPINANLVRDELLALRKNGTTIILSTHRMESVEEMCSHIALINKSKKILEGAVNEIRRRFRTQTYEVQYEGNNIAFANALGSNLKLLDVNNEHEYIVSKVQSLNNNSPNELLKMLIPHVEIHSFRELLPTMNEIFIQSVNQTTEENEPA
ncbi:MAG TPA: ABC transporter ATP-binding protein [Bacteroidia bacterium]|nr:ABC transporter ATP-binding protein [Bacteroidia bacterium]